MLKAVYPGSFDPITNGHVDIIERASKFVDKLTIGVLVNQEKSYLFTADERIHQIKVATSHIPNITVLAFSGLTVEFTKREGANVIIRGLRAVTDFENEFKMALTNRTLSESIETLFISTSTTYLYLSSSSVKEIASFGGNIDGMVHPEICRQIKEKYDLE